MLYRPGLLGRVPCPQDWYFGSGPPTIDTPLVGTGVIPAGWTFMRQSAVATDCLYSDALVTTFNSFSNDQPRFTPFGLMMEHGSTNLFLNSETPVTQSINVTANNTYTVWMHGTGTVTVSGAGITPTSGSPIHGTPFTFRATGSGGVTVACTAPVTRVQFEAAQSPTSYIPTGGASVTRADDQLYQNFLSNQLNVNEGTFWVEYIWKGITNFNDPGAQPVRDAKLMTCGVGSYASSNNTQQMLLYYLTPSNRLIGTINQASGIAVNSPEVVSTKTPGAVSRAAMSVSPTRIIVAQDYALSPPTTLTYKIPAQLAITLGGGGSRLMGFNGYIRGFRYWPFAMGDVELKECTSPEYYKNTPPVIDLDGTNASHWRPWSLLVANTQTATVTDALMSDPPGTPYTQFAPNTPRIGPRGVLLDSQRSNYFANSAAMAASGTTPALPAQFMFVSMRGTGSITITANTAVAVGLPVTVTQGTPTSFQVTTVGTVNYTCTGQVELAQLENVGTTLPTVGFTVAPGTFIRTTTANTARGGLGMQMPVGPWVGGPNCTYYIEVMLFLYQNGGMVFQLNDGTTANVEQFYTTYSNNTRTSAVLTVSGGVGQGGLLPDPSRSPPSILVYHKFAYTISDRKRQLAQDGILETTLTYGLLRAIAPTFLKLGITGTTYFANPCFIRRFRYYDYPIFDDDLVALTQNINDTLLDFSFLAGPLPPSITFTRSSTATYFDVNGTMQTAAINTPRFGFDPVTHAPRGLLLETPRTNFVIQSGAMASAPWAPIRATVAANAATVPDGTTTATRLTEDTSAATTHYMGETVATVPVNAPVTFSCFVHDQTRRYGFIQLYDNTTPANNVNASFDMVAGTVGAPTLAGAATNGSSSITNVGGGWYRVSVTATLSAVATTGVIARLFTANSTTTAVYTGDGVSSYYIWGAQVEAGVITSYIPTTTGAVARTTEAASMPVAGWFNAVQGTLAIDHMFPSSAPAGAFPMLAAFSDGTTNNRIYTYYGVSGLRYRCTITAGGVNNFDSLGGTAVPAVVGATAKSAVSWNATTGQHVVNGTVVASGAAVVPSVTQLAFGSDGVNPITDVRYISRFRYWQRALSITEMQQVTT